jgi:hypothetical protein
VTEDHPGRMRHPAGAGAGGRLGADPFLCRHIRTKTWLAPDAFGQGDPATSPSIAQYWCLKTMRPSGPDGGFVLPEECTDDRVCFEAITTTKTDS